MKIEIKETNCFMCGVYDANMTNHHGIPVHLKPKSNVLIPLCKRCHAKVNSVDIGAVASHLYKILKMLEEKKNAVIQLQKIVANHEKL